MGEGIGGGSQEGSAAARLAREVSALQASLLEKMQREMRGADVAEFADAARRLAEAFGDVTAAAVAPLSGAAPRTEKASPPAPPATAPPPSPSPDSPPSPPLGEHASLFKPGEMRRRLDQLIETHRRYGHTFCLVVFDVDGPATRNGHGSEAALEIVRGALADSIRLVDEIFPLEEEALCALAPSQDTVGGVQMSERLLLELDKLEAAGGLPIGISAGVAACPEHGDDAESLLRRADEAMWRARAVGQPVGVGALPRPPR